MEPCGIVSYMNYKCYRFPKVCSDLRLFDIVTKDGSPTLVPGNLHTRSTDDEANGSAEQLSITTTRSGRTVRKPVNSSSYSQTSDDGNVH